MIALKTTADIEQIIFRARTKLLRQAREFRFELVMIAIIMTAVSFLALSGVEVARGVSVSRDRPQTIVRLQIINGGAPLTLEKALRESLRGFSGRDVRVEVIPAEQIDVRDVGETLIVSRTGSEDAAATLAGLLGLGGDRVFFRPLEHNRRHITATLILGKDFSARSMELLTKKEITGRS